jgi:antitoxin (DNA-binding transcriptional repressor) of toxin-antitoxin stability system
MTRTISKSKFKPQALEYFRRIEKTREELIITDHGIPVLKVMPYTEKPSQVLKTLRGSVLQYDEPTAPTGEKWESEK